MLLLSAWAQAAPTRPAKVTVRLTGWISGFEEQAILMRGLEKFERTHPGIRVSYEPFLWTRTSTYMAEVLTAIRKGQAPDVIYLGCQEADAAIAADCILPLNGLIAGDGLDLGDFLPNLLAPYKKGDRIYGIPKDFNVLCLFYNRKLFAEAKLPFPDASWTWNMLRDAARRLTGKGHKGLCINGYDPAVFFAFVLQNGGRYLDDTKLRCVVDSPEAVKALEFLHQMRADDKSLMIPEDLGMKLPGVVFGKGKAAMMIEGGWVTPYLRRAWPALGYSAVPLPSGPAAKASTLLTVAYAIPREARHPKEAWALIQFLTGRENQARVMKEGLAFPSRRSVLTLPSLKANPVALSIMQDFDRSWALDYGRAGIKMDLTLRDAMGKVFEGKETPQKALESAAVEINRWIEILNR